MVADGQTLYVVGKNDHLRAFDLADGKELWAFTGNPAVTPRAANDPPRKAENRK